MKTSCALVELLDLPVTHAHATTCSTYQHYLENGKFLSVLKYYS
jgi:hypothetical protein